ncbi:MAG: polyketide synthase dehydratase domain-containing protein, partial [Phycisphaerae bacterium]|nr:polyketide synthase dehydratase domain-containing protein [Phycisphaerae bacterium]
MDAHGHAAAKASDSLHERRMVCPAEHEPIAIIGIGCRLPGGVNDAGSFWRLLRDGRDAITKIPSDRWSIDAFYDPATGVPGKSISCYGGFIHNVGDFDADFFGISPREAARMDPQQRLLLEVAWEAIEDAGQVIDPAIGSDTGVFVGLSNQDYMLIQNAFCEPTDVDAHSNTGVAVSIAANRISYCLNLRGPSMVVDTACSASLVAVHLACRSLRHGECRLALAGGVNLLLKPEGFVGFSKLSMLSPDGKSKVFDARANGMTRSEGAAMIALKPLAAAVAAGDPVYAVILASATNQDGRTTGLTMPNGKAQEALMAEACAKAGIDPARLQYVEAHGTGTTVGDPIEANALGAVLSVGRPAGETCVIGSVKSNLGHLEPASGIAGLLKTTLALKHREIPPNLHFETPNPDIPFQKFKLRVAKRLEPWPAHAGPALAGVNSFGFGGSNAHIVLQEAPEPAAPRVASESVARRPWLLPLSARSQDALEDIARAYHEALSDGGSLADAALRDVCHTAAQRRLHHDYRLAVVAEDRRALISHLGAFLMGERRPTVASNRVTSGKRPKVAFVCSGQGPQWWAMGRELYAAEPVFADMINRCDAILRQHAKWSLRAELLADESDSKMDVTSIAQPAIFAIQVALAALWRSWGVEPDLVIGHSVGEVAAAYIAGALSLEDAVRVILHRGRCMDLASAEGAMLAVGLSPEQARAAIAGHADRVSVAACNSPTACTLSGDREPLEAIRAELDAKDVFCRFLRVNYAFHSAHMEPIQEELIRSLDGITAKPAAIPLVSTVTGDWIDGETLTPAYWWKNVRQSVRFAEGVDRLIERECDTFVELSPHPVLGSAVTECLMQHGAKATVVASLRRKEPEQATMLGSLAALYTVGYPVDWNAMHPDGGACVRLPAYPWQRQRLWHETKGSETFRLAPNQHPLLGRRLNSSHPTWETRVDTRLYPYLRDHCVQGHALLPGTGYFEMALAAAARVLGDGPCAVEEFELPKACFVSDDTLTVLHTVLNPNDNVVQIASETDAAEDTWTVHAQGRVRRLEEGAMGERVDLDAIRRRCTTEVGRDECYRKIHEVGLDYGPTFQGIGRLWTGDEEALAQMRAPDELGFATAGYLFHPAVLDACFQVITGAIPTEGSHARHVYLAVQFEQVRVYGRPCAGLWTHARIVEKGNRELVSEVRVCDGDGNVVLEVHGLRAQAVDDAKAAESDQTQDLLYEYQWQLKPIEGRRCVRGAAESLPSPKAMLEQVRPRSTALVEHLGLTEQFGRFEEQIDATSPVYIVTALRAMGWDPKPGDRMTTEALADQLGVADRHRRLLHWYLGMLEEEGILRSTGTAWQVLKTPEAGNLAATWRTLLAENPAFYAELAMLERCGRHLPEMLRGEVDPLQLIFPEGSLAAAEHLYQDAPMLRFANTVAQHVVHEALQHLPRGRTIRVLEIGAGTGGLSTFVLPELPADRTEYVFTDLSKHFFNKAEQKFRDFPFIEYHIFDVEQDPAAQGFEPHTFDLIFASEVLHATQDLRQTLRNVKKLLASDGLLVTLEAVKRSRWIDLVFGLTDGWWRFTDTDLRPNYPLLPLSRWCEVLIEEGFREPCDMSGQDEDRVENAVIVARGPRLTETVAASLAEDQSTLDGEWLLFADRGGTARRLADRIEEHGGRCTLVFAGAAPSNNGKALAIEPDRPEAMDKLLLGDGRRYRGIVHLWNLDAPSAAEATTPAIEAALTSGCLSTVY